MRDKYLKGACIFALTANLILFFAKLYIGLGANSIAIYSDGINNLFDSLSGLISLLCLSFLAGNVDISSKGYISKAEDLLTFIMSVIIGFTGCYFAYSSIERFMYPTSISYRTQYLYILIATSLAKLIMYTVFRYLHSKSKSDILKVMSADCILDFCITSVTIMTLLISTYGSYAADAVCGIIISVIITVSAVKMIIASICKLIGYVKKDTRDTFLESLFEIIDESTVDAVRYSLTDSKTEAYVYSAEYPCEEKINELSKKTGITVYIIHRKESTEKSV
ncbi:MAG: cation diffusion facilitator family transporter [Clostridia bacterium]|nr:cation diffusion facilitator family transporter [Clostridia bacterium]